MEVWAAGSSRPLPQVEYFAPGIASINHPGPKGGPRKILHTVSGGGPLAISVRTDMPATLEPGCITWLLRFRQQEETGVSSEYLHVLE